MAPPYRRLKANYCLARHLVGEVTMNPSKPFAMVPPRTLSVTGMHCVACQGRVKQVLEELDGIEHVDVDLDAGHAIVHFASGPVNCEVLVEAVRRAGYQAEPEPSRSATGRVCELSVTGMSCAAPSQA
jgi:copper chaperone CopZ